MASSTPSSISRGKGDEIKGGGDRILTLSDLLADDVRDYFLRESDGDLFDSRGRGGNGLPQSREEGRHPFRPHGGRESNFVQPYSYLSASSDSDADSIDSGGIGRSSSTSSSLFHGVTKTKSSETHTSGGGWSSSSPSSSRVRASYNYRHPLDKPDSLIYAEGGRGPYQTQQRHCSHQQEDSELMNDRCYHTCSGEECGESSRSTLLDDNQYSDSSADSSDTSSNCEHPQHYDNGMYHRDEHKQQAPLYQNVDLSDKLVRFHHSLELKQDDERDRLLGKYNGSGSLQYSSMNTSSAKGALPNGRRTVHYKTNNRRLGGPGSIPLRLDDAIEIIQGKMNTMLSRLELFISNMPSLVGSLALAWCSLGVDWFKWYEITFDTCRPTNYHSQLCEYTEFPGCFVCETDRGSYQFFLQFHYLCSTIAFILSSFLVGKIIIAFPVVRDELANPTTAAPLGLLCMAFEKVFAGNFGCIGEVITFVASALQTAVGCWFIFISVVYKTLPEPSWFPNTTGIGLAAVKMYLYWTMGAYFLSVFSLVAFSMFYVVALYRIHTNAKISLPVCWVQLSGPAVVLYGFTIFSQPGSFGDNSALLIPENKAHFTRIHQEYYMPVIHVLFAFCMISMVSSLYLLRARWKTFRDKEFSPAHVSFCAPLFSHANAMQAYISSLNLFSPLPPESMFKLSGVGKVLLYNYWTFCLICGTMLILVMTGEFVRHLPCWCQLDVEDDEMPPEPEKTIVSQLLQRGDAGDSMTQSFVSAAVLQANESGALVRVLRGGEMKYVRSRRMPSMGFDPIMNVSELLSERDLLLQRVTHNAIPARDRGGISSFNGTPFVISNEAGRPGRHRLNCISLDNM